MDRVFCGLLQLADVRDAPCLPSSTVTKVRPECYMGDIEPWGRSAQVLACDVQFVAIYCAQHHYPVWCRGYRVPLEL